MGQTQSRIQIGSRKRIVLVGGGHANVQVLKILCKTFTISNDEESGFHISLISDYPKAFYSGMLPGCISGIYTPEQTQIDLVALCEWCGAKFIHAKVTGIDWDAKELICEGELSRFGFDILSINIGSTSRNSNIPGIEHAITTRPISELFEKIQQTDKKLSAMERKTRNIVVVGAGAAGVELAWAFKSRMTAMGYEAKVTLVHGSKNPILAERGNSAINNVAEKLRQHNISVVLGSFATHIEPQHVTLSSGKQLEFDYLLWATGASAPECLPNYGLQLDTNGFILVSETLQSLTHKCVFAGGDCCSVEGHKLAKSGVYSVREGPVIANNIINMILGNPLEKYVPQTGFLALLNTSDGEAISCWKGTSFVGSWIMQQKDRIDQKFMDGFKPHLLGPPLHSFEPKASS